MRSSILELVSERVVLLDGGMGTELIKRGFPMGACPESWNLDSPDQIQDVHRSYFQAGSDAVLTNSFGGSRIKLAAYDLDSRCREVNRRAAELAVEVRPDAGFVGGSMGPIGKFLQPQGEYREEQFEEAYREQAGGLVEGGVDFILIETQYDLRETLCALRAARGEAKDIPVFVTMTFNRTPHGFFTLMGNRFSDFSEQALGEGAEALGANCTLDSRDMADLVAEMTDSVDFPVIAQANAGQPEPQPDGTIRYSQPPEEYVSFLPSMIESGVGILGGCCGTDPEYIRLMASIIHRR